MARCETVDYDQGVAQYAAHRRIHGQVLEQLSKRSRRGPRHVVLEVGCGSGNYSGVLATHHGCAVVGLDPSAGMLGHAHAQHKTVVWLQARGQELAFARGTFDLVFSVDVIHHISDRAGYYFEAARVLRPGGWVCTVTDSEEIIRRREILSGYFPETVEEEIARYPRIGQLEGWMADVGLEDLNVVTVEEPYKITTAQPFRDRAYSSLHLIGDEAWQDGVQRLERDLANGPICGMSRYACVWGRKPRGR